MEESGVELSALELDLTDIELEILLSGEEVEEDGICIECCVG